MEAISAREVMPIRITQTEDADNTTGYAVAYEEHAAEGTQWKLAWSGERARRACAEREPLVVVEKGGERTWATNSTVESIGARLCYPHGRKHRSSLATCWRKRCTVGARSRAPPELAPEGRRA